MIPLTVWMNHPSFYQSDMFRSLVKTGRVDLQVIYAKDLPGDRKGLGWQSDTQGYQYQFLDHNHPLVDALRIAYRQRRRIHIVNGVWAEPAFAVALATLASMRSSYAIYSEAANTGVIRTLGKRLIRNGFGRFILSGAKGVLPVSRMGAQFFRELGVKDQQIYPFGYFRSDANVQHIQLPDSETNRMEVIFVGQLIYRKGVDLLLEAMRPFFDLYPSLNLVLIGRGEMQKTLLGEIHRLGFEERVNFEGVLSPGDIPARIAKSDLLVLPSRWDGWGLVVNEALSVGVPVVISDRCGAADLIQQKVNGYIFRNEDVADLRACLAHFFARRTDWPAMRMAAAECGQRISTEHVAPYFLECLEHMIGNLKSYPTAPWIYQSSLD